MAANGKAPGAEHRRGPQDRAIPPRADDPASTASNLFQQANLAPTRLVLGVDPGVNGALALLTAEGILVDVVDMPTLLDGTGGKRAINAPLLAVQVKAWGPAMAFVEFVGARPGEGPVGAFSFGRCRGVIEGTLGALTVPVEMLAPSWWKRRIGIPPGKEGAKDAARSEAIRRWPGMADRFARVKDDGRAEAALIAVAGLSRDGHVTSRDTADRLTRGITHRSGHVRSDAFENAFERLRTQANADGSEP